MSQLDFENSLNDPRFILSGIPSELADGSNSLKFTSALGNNK